jgi:succinate dehydrogenase hydrophobic anchor subunit
LDQFEHARKSVIIMLIILVTGIVIMASFISHVFLDIQDISNQMKNKKIESDKLFLEYAFGVNSAFLDTIEDGWNVYESKDINFFVKNILPPLSKSAAKSVIIVLWDNKQQKYIGYLDEKYAEVVLNIPFNNLKLNEPSTFPGSINKSFGSHNRFFYEARELSEDVILIVGFNEQIMYSNFISNIDLNLLYEIDKKKTCIERSLIIFMVFVICVGFFLLWQVTSMRRKFVMEISCDKCGVLKVSENNIK